MKIENLKTMIEAQQSVKLSIRKMTGSMKRFVRLGIVGKDKKGFDFVYMRTLQDLLNATTTIRQCFIDDHSIMVEYK